MCHRFLPSRYTHKIALAEWDIDLDMVHHPSNNYSFDVFHANGLTLIEFANCFELEPNEKTEYISNSSIVY